MAELRQEKALAEHAYENARRRGLPKAEGFRTPWEINQEMNTLRQLYLVRVSQ